MITDEQIEAGWKEVAAARETARKLAALAAHMRQLLRKNAAFLARYREESNIECSTDNRINH